MGVVINVLIGPGKADEADCLLQDYPRLPVVLGHCLGLKARPHLKLALAEVLRLSRRQNLYAKLSFVPTGSSFGYPCQDLHEPCLAIVKVFGAQRCGWGSDFPCGLWCPKVSYAEHLRIFTHDLPLNSAERTAILGQTARRLWFSPVPPA